MTNIDESHYQTFEDIKELTDNGTEFWRARALQNVLDYKSWDKFKRVIEKARVACENSDQPTENHFSQLGKMVNLGSGSQRKIEDIRLSRYACYLVVQNADPSKPIVATGQTYFAIQTRRQELSDNQPFQLLQEEEQRLFLRKEMREHNKQLVQTAQQAGVKSNLDFAIFQNHGYKGLYGGLDAKAIHHNKGLKKSQQILDNMGSTELAANLFRATQAEEKLRRDGVQDKGDANKTHFNVGQKVRQTIEDLGGTMPENLPIPEEDLKKIEQRVKTFEKNMINIEIPKT